MWPGEAGAESRAGAFLANVKVFGHSVLLPEAEGLGKGVGLQLEGLGLDFRKHIPLKERNLKWKLEKNRRPPSGTKNKPLSPQAHH